MTADFATRVETYLDQERHAGVRQAAALIREGRPGYALFKLARSVERQNRIAGGGTVAIAPLCACGGRCEHGASGVAS